MARDPVLEQANKVVKESIDEVGDALADVEHGAEKAAAGVRSRADGFAQTLQAASSTAGDLVRRSPGAAVCAGALAGFVVGFLVGRDS